MEQSLFSTVSCQKCWDVECKHLCSDLDETCFVMTEVQVQACADPQHPELSPKDGYCPFAGC